MTAEQIKKFAEEYLDWKIVDLEHEFLYNGQVIGTLMESHITTSPQIVKFIDGTPREYPTGTWFVTLKITDQDVIQGIKDGHYTGGSATTIERKDAEKLKRLLNSHVPASTKSQIKRIKISDIKDPVVITISIVHSPCVPLAKFCSLKSKEKVSHMTKELNEQIEEETKGFISKIGEILGSTKSDKEKDEDEIVDDGSKKQPDFITAAEFDDFKSEIIELVTAMNDKVNEIVKASSKSDDEENGEGDEPVGLTPEEEKELERLLAKKEASTKSDEEKEEDEVDEEDEEDEIKASSKSTPVHDTGAKSKPQSDSAIVYGIMGRDNTGSAKRK